MTACANREAAVQRHDARAGALRTRSTAGLDCVCDPLRLEHELTTRIAREPPSPIAPPNSGLQQTRPRAGSSCAAARVGATIASRASARASRARTTVAGRAASQLNPGPLARPRRRRREKWVMIAAVIGYPRVREENSC